MKRIRSKPKISNIFLESISLIKKDRLYSPSIMSSFLNDMLSGKYKDWDYIKLASSNLNMCCLSGRVSPITSGGDGCSSPKDMLKFAYAGSPVLRKHFVTPYPCLNLTHLKNDNERIQAIIKADCSPEIKKDLLLMHRIETQKAAVAILSCEELSPADRLEIFQKNNKL